MRRNPRSLVLWPARVLEASSVLTLLIALVTLAACSSTKPVSMQFDDAAIKTQILAKLSTNGRTNPFRIDVQVSEGDRKSTRLNSSH